MMCDSDSVTSNRALRGWVSQGLPECLTKLGIREVKFEDGVSYHKQQAAFAELCNLGLRDANLNEAWVHGEHLMETDV